MADSKPECIFCRIAGGEAPCFKIYEDGRHLGFLDIFPNTEAFSIVIPKEHRPSDFAAAPPAVLDGLMQAARQLAGKITAAYGGVDRCAVVIEGMQIDHLHAKLIPLHRTAGKRPGGGPETTASGGEYFEAYPGYVTTRITSEMADREHLARVAEKINRGSGV